MSSTCQTIHYDAPQYRVCWHGFNTYHAILYIADISVPSIPPFIPPSLGLKKWGEGKKWYRFSQQFMKFPGFLTFWSLKTPHWSPWGGGNFFMFEPFPDLIVQINVVLFDRLGFPRIFTPYRCDLIAACMRWSTITRRRSPTSPSFSSRWWSRTLTASTRRSSPVTRDSAGPHSQSRRVSDRSVLSAVFRCFAKLKFPKYLLTMYIQTEFTWYTTPKYQYWSRAIFGRFSKKKIPSETWTQPPTSIVNSDFFILLLCKALIFKK